MKPGRNSTTNASSMWTLMWRRLRVPHPENALDKLIATTALLHDLAVVSHNRKHFEATGLKVVNAFST